MLETIYNQRTFFRCLYHHLNCRISKTPVPRNESQKISCMLTFLLKVLLNNNCTTIEYLCQHISRIIRYLNKCTIEPLTFYGHVIRVKMYKSLLSDLMMSMHYSVYIKMFIPKASRTK